MDAANAPSTVNVQNDLNVQELVRKLLYQGFIPCHVEVSEYSFNVVIVTKKTDSTRVFLRTVKIRFEKQLKSLPLVAWSFYYFSHSQKRFCCLDSMNS